MGDPLQHLIVRAPRKATPAETALPALPKTGLIGKLKRTHLLVAFLFVVAFLLVPTLPSRASAPNLAISGKPAFKTATLMTPTALEPARRALLEGRADEADALLHRALTANPGDGPAHLLLCRVLLSEDLGKDAAAECTAALSDGLSQDSEAQDWTGRALGRQASNAGMLAGMRLALGVRTAFEAAVSLSPDSEPACVDLGKYYTGAPAVVGGGTTRALALASRIAPSLPEVAHRIRAMAAEKNTDLGTAEREFQAEVNVAHRPGALVDLAAFYSRHGQSSKAIAIAGQAIAADRAVDATVVEAAGILADVGQIPASESALRAYLSRGTHTDGAPVFRVHTQLGGLLARTGQRDAARAEYTAALTLASRYAPAQKGLAAL